ncbi:penicillin-binding protein activator LpoB [Candidatus Binatia bacterium]|nr:penicillin-binding protein activator LpoB [Candidatus Binatia bacterium]
MTKLAVAIDDSSRRIDGTTRRSVEDEFIRALLSKGYTVASRSDVDALLDEVKFQQRSGFTDRDAAKLGKALNVPAVLIVTIGDVGTTSRKVRVFGERSPQRVDFTRATVGARLVDVERAEILWTGSSNGEYATERAYQNQVIGMVAKAVARAVPDRS